jgi:ribosomal protein L25 (general stress protein Ctc)
LQNLRVMLSIYALIDPRSGRVRYVGITKLRLEQRLAEHLKTARSGKPFPVCRWLRILLSLDLIPRCELLEQTTDPLRECTWIALYRSEQPDLLNCTGGGEGLFDPSPEVRLKLSQANKGRLFSAAHRQKLSLAKQGTTHTPEARLKIATAHKGKAKPAFSAAHRANISKAQKGRRLSDEQKQKLSVAGKGRPGRPHSDETRAKISAVQTGKKRGPKSPELRARIAATLTGRVRSEQERANIKRGRANGKKPARIYRPLPEAVKEKIRAAKIGQTFGPMSEERKQKISAAKKAQFALRRLQQQDTPSCPHH